jgi:signal transduction histidine kinase
MDEPQNLKGEKKPSILIVDDTPKNIQLLANILAKHDFRIAVSTSGEHALSMVSKEPPDLLLLDVTMPGLDGFEVCRRIKSNPRTEDIPTIFLTARDSVEDKVKGLEAGGVDYIAKPFEPLEVLARIRTHLELKRSREIIKQHNDSLEQMLAERTHDLIRAERQAAVGQMLEGIVHNLRGPLTIIVGNTGLVKLHLDRMNEYLNNQPSIYRTDIHEMVEVTSSTVQKVEEGTQRIGDMISSLMRKSRSDHSAAMEIVDLNNLITLELDFLMADLCFKHKVSKDIELCEEELEIMVVPGEIAQVFQNLISNAMDATHNQANTCLKIGTEINGNYARFTVADNGPGIPEEILPYIFDPFFTTKPKSGEKESNEPVGTGLGLYMCNEIIKAHQGTIEAFSDPQNGTRFVVSLPLASKRKENKHAHESEYLEP